MSLGFRLALLVFLAAAPIFAYEINAEFERRDERRNHAIGEVLQLAELVAANESRFVDSAYYLLSALSTLDAVRSGQRDVCSRQFQIFRQRFPDLTGIGAFGRDGNSTCSSTPGAPVVNLGDRPYFQEAVRTRSFTSSGFIVGRVTGQGSFTFVLPVLGEDQEVQGVVLAAFSSGSLSGALREIPLPQNAVVSLIDSQGVVVARTHDEERWVGKNVADQPYVRQMLAQKRGTAEATSFDGVARFYGFASVRQPANLLVAVGMPSAGIFLEADRRLRQEIAVLGTVVLIVAALAYAYAEYGIGRPIRALDAAVARFVRGAAPRVEPTTTGIKEVAQLSRNLGEMSAELHARETALKSAVEAKEVLLKEVNHRVKNSLQLVTSLSGLHRAQIKDPVARRQFTEASRRIATVARVHQRLYQTADVQSMDFGRYLNELCEDLSASLVERPDQRLICNSEDLHLPTDQVVPLALILNELITNCFKHALNGRAGTIEISCRRAPGGAVQIDVVDDGPGIKDGSGGPAAGGLGLRLVDALTKQLGGTFAVRSTGKGASFSIVVPAA